MFYWLEKDASWVTYSVHCNVNSTVLSFVSYHSSLLTVGIRRSVIQRRIDSHSCCPVGSFIGDVVQTSRAVAQCRVRDFVEITVFNSSFKVEVTISHREHWKNLRQYCSDSLPRMFAPLSLMPWNVRECPWSLVTMTRVLLMSTNFSVAFMASDNLTVSRKAWAACPRWCA